MVSWCDSCVWHDSSIGETWLTYMWHEFFVWDFDTRVGWIHWRHYLCMCDMTPWFESWLIYLWLVRESFVWHFNARGGVIWLIWWWVGVMVVRLFYGSLFKKDLYIWVRYGCVCMSVCVCERECVFVVWYDWFDDERVWWTPWVIWWVVVIWLVHVWCDIFMWNSTHSHVMWVIHVGHHSFMCETWRIHVGHDWFRYEAPIHAQAYHTLSHSLTLIHVCRDCLTWDMTHSCVMWLIRVGCDSFMWDMTHLLVPDESCNGTWLISCKNSSVTRRCGTWLISLYLTSPCHGTWLTHSWHSDIHTPTWWIIQKHHIHCKYESIHIYSSHTYMPARAHRHDSIFCNATHLFVTWLNYIMSSRRCLIHVWQDSFTCDAAQSCVTWFIHIWDMTPSYVIWPFWLRIRSLTQLGARLRLCIHVYVYVYTYT